MAGSLKERLTDRVEQLREERPSVDHAVRMQQHYGAAKAGQQAGAVTYFGFLSFFPIMALAFFLVGYVAKVYPGAQDTLVSAIDSMLPGIIGTRDNQIQLSDIQDAAGAVGLIGLAGVLYSGLGWLSALRDALIAVFDLPQREQPSFVKGKLRDLVTLAIIGTVLLVAVAVSGFVSGFSGDLLAWLGLSTALGWLVTLLTIAFGLAANTVLFFAMFRLLAAPDIPVRAMLSGALLGAVGFEVLKQISGLLIRSTQGQPAFQVFGLALILLVWINYFSRVTLYAAAWAWTDPLAREQRITEPSEPVQGPASPSLDHLRDTAEGETPASRKGALAAGAALGAAGAAAAAAVAKARKDGA
ncbi:YihY/virulence factor BrkB family protein [Nocardioides flavescens]|uniref:YihY/virulence factor BrkB family protein n=1 Tax=Nocardioides flavescens TaxID=2691959 RepID=A0A6L7EVK2_9ACTN|nr:YihY/virulence factor BrkB family protein [Nocardioides flavescens]MXG89468.1 YihY/virulence factor BrkB family protein [Nocardioides flavescens]